MGKNVLVAFYAQYISIWYHISWYKCNLKMNINFILMHKGRTTCYSHNITAIIN